MSKRLLMKGLGVFLSFILLISMGCNSKQTSNTNENKEPVTIEIWHTYSDTEEKVFNEKIIPAFEAQYPNIKVKSTRMPYDGLKQQVIQAVSGNAVPDLMRMDIIWVPEFAKLGALQELDQFEGFNEVKSNLFEAPLSTNFYNDHYYGLPLNTNTKVAIYNKALLNAAGLTEPPKTFDELVNYLEKAKGSLGLGVSGTGIWGISPWFLSLGGRYTDENCTKATGYLNSENSIKALEKLVALYDKKLIGPSILGGQPSTWDGIKTDKYFMIDDGPWFYSILGDEAKQKTIPTLMPSGDGGSMSVVGGEDLVLFKGAKHPNEAWLFMKYLMSEEPQKIMATETGLIPTNVNAANSQEVSSNPITKVYVEQLKTTWARTPHPNYEKMQEKIDLAFEKVFRHKATAKEALDEAAKEVDALLQEK